MDEKIKDYILKIAMIWILTGAVLTLPAACMKAASAFYHQVIIKDQIAGDIKKN